LASLKSNLAERYVKASEVGPLRKRMTRNNENWCKW
jgi:hypothetical protein